MRVRHVAVLVVVFAACSERQQPGSLGGPRAGSARDAAAQVIDGSSREDVPAAADASETLDAGGAMDAAGPADAGETRDADEVADGGADPDTGAGLEDAGSACAELARCCPGFTMQNEQRTCRTIVADGDELACVRGLGVAMRAGACNAGDAGARDGGPRDAGPRDAGNGGANCSMTSVGLTPLTDFAPGANYRGQPGGLWPGGRNIPPAAHAAAGLTRATAIEPRNASGATDPNGAYVLISIGMSNTTQEFSVFKTIADADPDKDPRLVIVDGAQGGVTAARWANPTDVAWTVLDQRLSMAQVTAPQVSVAWVKLANAQPTQGWPNYAQTLDTQTRTILQSLRSRFPNLEIAYVSSRIYAGYASTPLNPEPYAYEGAFAVRWMLEAQVNGVPELNYDSTRGAIRAPWISWGPYLWADGLTPRSDGLTWECSDLTNDGTHPSGPGRRKVADELLEFFETDRTAREWFLAAP